jgi:2-dehydropantoate 2-reductase
VARTAPGQFHNGTSGALVVERQGERGRAITEALRSAKFDVEWRADAEAVLWSKLLVNLNNAVNALAGVPLRQQLSDRGYRQVMARCLFEGLAALKGAGIAPVRVGKLIPKIAPTVLALPDWLFFRVAAAMVKIDPKARSSMLDDLDRGRTTEVDFLNGEIVALGAKHGVPTPANRAIVGLVKQAEAAKAGSPKLTASALLSAIG